MAHGSDTSDGGTTPMGERDFMAAMVPHHESAVMMARLALKKAQHPEVRRLAGAIVAVQGAEIARLRSWHEAWFGEPLRPDESGPHASVDMVQLETAAGDFDRVFLRMMIPHHASAITMAERAMMGKPRQEIAALTQGIVAAQAKEIGQMQRWRERWYRPLG